MVCKKLVVIKIAKTQSLCVLTRAGGGEGIFPSLSRWNRYLLDPRLRYLESWIYTRVTFYVPLKKWWYVFYPTPSKITHTPTFLQSVQLSQVMGNRSLKVCRIYRDIKVWTIEESVQNVFTAHTFKVGQKMQCKMAKRFKNKIKYK